MTLNGINDLLAFANLLRAAKVEYRLEHSRHDALTIQLFLIGAFIEIDFFDDHIEYTFFEGSESVLDDQERLFALIDNAKG
ncbi:MAG TPA: hypothetical protein VHA70_10360 [Bauldia sp.]|nr:hypothetical protein [Bauldia sp.]